MIHESHFTIRTFHTDAFGHVNNSRHLELQEEARWQYAEHIGLIELLKENGLGFIIVDMRMKFRNPIFEGEIIRIETSLITLGSASGEVRQLVYKVDDQGENSTKRGSKLSVRSLFHFILIDRETGASVPIAGDIRDLLLGVVES